MLSKELITEFKDVYETNDRALNEWNDRMLESMDDISRIESLMERSKAIRKMYREDMDVLSRLKREMPEELKESDAELLYDMLKDFYDNMIDDYVVISEVGNRLVEYYHKTGDYLKEAELLHILGVEATFFYVMMLPEKTEEITSIYLRAVNVLLPHIDELPLEGIVRIFKAYGNVVKLSADDHSLEHAHRKQTYCLTVCDAVWDIYDRCKSRFDEDGLDKLNTYLNSIDSCALAAIATVRELSIDAKLLYSKESLLNRMAELYEEVDVEYCESPENVADWLMYRHVKGEIDESRVLDGMLKTLMRTVPTVHPDDASYEAVFPVRVWLNLAAVACEWLDFTLLPHFAKRRIFADFYPTVKRVMLSIPYAYFPEMFGSFITSTVRDALKYRDSMRDQVDMIDRLVIRRQPITYIHSVMVREISLLILDRVFDECPWELVGVLGMKDVTEVRLNRERLVQYLSGAAMLHDIGKCEIEKIINLQHRRLDDREFMLIKHHPDFGLRFLEEAPDLKPYFDIIAGHHKYYDGSSGYPSWFDNTASSVRFIIDIITVADTIDAATDILGRNYAKGKDFDTVLGEMKLGAGTRYNPRIVKLIEDNPSLYSALEDITSAGRFNVYRKAYRDITESKH